MGRARSPGALCGARTPACRVTVRLAQMAEKAGVAWIAVHGRTTRQRSSTPPDLSVIKLVRFVAGTSTAATDVLRISERAARRRTAATDRAQVKESVAVPVIANGDIFSLEDALDVQRKTGVDGAYIPIAPPPLRRCGQPVPVS